MASYKLLRGPPAAALGSFALAGVGLAVYRKSIFAEAHAEARDPQPQDASGLAGTILPAAPKVFSSGPSMVSLRLKSSEDVNHNTKLLRFEYPNPEAVSGLSLTCKPPHPYQHSLNADTPVAAVLTMSWPQGSLLPVMRPYTPVSQLGAHTSSFVR